MTHTNEAAPALERESGESGEKRNTLLSLSREFLRRNPDYTTEGAGWIRERLTRNLMSHLDEIAFQLSVPGDARHGEPTLFDPAEGLDGDEADTVALCYLERFAGDYLSETARRMTDWLREELSEG